MKTTKSEEHRFDYVFVEELDRRILNRFHSKR
jgi:hypothetical protein